MAKDKLTEYSTTNASNDVIGDISVSEGMLPSAVNNALREQMTHLKNFADGTDAIDALAVDNLKLDGNTISSTDTNGDITIDPDGTGVVDVTGGLTTLGTVSTTARDGAIVDYSGSISRFVAGRAGGSYGQWEAHVAGASGVTKRYQIDYDSTTRWYAANGTTERMRLTSGGALLIATATAGGNGYTFDASGFLTHARASGAAQSMVGFKNGGSFVGEIRTSTTATAYITSSDYRLKENVTATWDATTRLKQLNPVRFNFIADPNTVVDGFIAHEVQDVVPESISGNYNEVEVWKDGEELPDGVSVGDNKLDDDGNTIPVMQGIDQAKLVPLLCKTILELEARITALESS